MVSYNITNIEEALWRRFVDTIPRSIDINSALKFIIEDWILRVEKEEVDVPLLFDMLEKIKKEGDTHE